MKYLLSGPPSCLCSKVEECKNTGENELDNITNILEVIEILINLSEAESLCLRRLTVRPCVMPTLTVPTTLGEENH